MYQLSLSVEMVERMIENLIRISEAYVQKALEFEARSTPEGLSLSVAYRKMSQLAAADAHTLQLAAQAQQNQH